MGDGRVRASLEADEPAEGGFHRARIDRPSDAAGKPHDTRRIRCGCSVLFA
jgi:hypothetical protein